MSFSRLETNFQFMVLAQREEISGSQEINATSEDEAQNASVKDDDSMTVVTNGEDDIPLSQSTPVKLKKRKEGSSEHGSAKKQKVVPLQ